MNDCGMGSKKTGVEEKCSVHHGKSPSSLSLQQHSQRVVHEQDHLTISFMKKESMK